MTGLSGVPDYPAGHQLLAGRVVVVTAAAGTGIGSATARRCLEEGASVVISDWHQRRLTEMAEQLGEVTGITPLAVPCDVTDDQQVQSLLDAAVAEHGRIDVLVNNAGLGGEVTLEEMTSRGLASRKGVPVKILAKGEISKPLTVHAHGFSRAAREQIEAAGGTCQVVEE
jgi:NAD(P)-dependent dehydrogenase (short-subunit alcohol dehydrogenase family)